MFFVKSLFIYKYVKVAWSEPRHAVLLARVWEGMTPEVAQHPFPGQKHEGWKQLGFQGADPQTDFRGAGELALLVCQVYSVWTVGGVHS